ncbi:hypothetical protein R3Q06_32630 [Rhodococcus erythropolis]|uniref:hypothetical protein n=1 Tax=Rhodococcus erythropolis TaxID=1833 RepID=UPI002948DFCF|nr:hypothetical protein [Rhodococcus erythropolis]MDV6278213.1 hypothetical protein [Rhodococcus erythropolis]
MNVTNRNLASIVVALLVILGGRPDFAGHGWFTVGWAVVNLGVLIWAWIFLAFFVIRNIA